MKEKEIEKLSEELEKAKASSEVKESAEAPSVDQGWQGQEDEDAWGNAGWEVQEPAVPKAAAEDKAKAEVVSEEKTIKSIFDANTYAEGDSDGDEEDIKIDEALKSAGANLWNWVSGS